MARVARNKVKKSNVPDHVLLTSGIEFAEGEPDSKKSARFSGVAYSGGLLGGWNSVVDLESTIVPDSMPVLTSHDKDADAAIGVVIEHEKNGALKVSGELFSDIDEGAASIAAKARRGIKYQMSMGLYGFSIESIASGKSVQVNGKSFNGPVDVLRGGTTREVSIVTLGADPNTSVNMFSKKSTESEDDPMDLQELQTRITALEGDLTKQKELTASEKQRADGLQAKLDEQRKSVREASVKALFKEIGREFKADEAKVYLDLEMSDTAFESVKTDMLKLKPRAGAHLFQEFAQGDTAGTLGKSALRADAERRGWVKAA